MTDIRRACGRPFLALASIAAGSTLGIVANVNTVSADPVAEFYQGKKMQFVIRSAPGGGYDLYSRLLARHIVKHIPGHPDIIPVNMPAGGGIAAANYVANVAPRDGTILTMIGQALPMDQALGLNKSLQADLSTFHWLGNMSNSNQLTYAWHTSPTKTIEDAKKRETTVGASGSGDMSAWMPEVYNSILGTRFKVIAGYPGGNDIDLAMERGEVEAKGINPWASLSSVRPNFVRDKLINILVQVGLEKEKELPNVPLLRDLATNPEDRAVLDYVSKVVAVGRAVATSPGVPQDRVAALRRAFDLTLEDPAFKADAEKQKAEINPMTGAELQQIIEELIHAPQPLLERVRMAVQPRGRGQSSKGGNDPR